MKRWYIGLLVFGFAFLGSVTAWKITRPVQSFTALSPTATVVCGKFAAPPLLVGVPLAVPAGGTAVSFQDGYLLQLKEVPSMFIGKRALFQVVDGKVVNYGLVEADYNPCPAKP